MRRFPRAIVVAAVLALGPLLAACESFDLDKLDVFGLNEKKKLPGERKPVFPEGVPGVTQGVPPELMKGNQPPPETAEAQSAEKAAEAAPPPEKPKPKPKPRRIMVSKPAPQQQGAQSPWPEPPQQQNNQAQAPWPNPQQQQAPQAAWPEPRPSGTFSR